MNGKFEKYQRGVALLLALGFLSLLLVTGIAFVTNATVARKSAANFQFHSQAKTLAVSAANRLAAGIRYTLEKNAEPGGPLYFDPTLMTSVGNAAETDDKDVLEDKDSLLTSIVWGVKFIPESLHADHLPQWEYQYDRYKSDGTLMDDARIIGRVAYMALTPSATINFSEVLRGSTDVDNGSWSKWDKRRGFGIRELKIDLPADATAKNKLLARFQDETFPDEVDKQDFAKSKSDASVTASKNRTEDITDYQDYDTIFSNGGLSDTVAQNRLRAWFMPSGYNEPEIFAYNPDTKNDGYNEKTLFYHRLNLARLDSDGKSVWESDAKEAERVTVDTLLGDPERFNEKLLTHPVARALPYLKSIVGTDPSYTAELRRKQIAANLIDYCDSDHKPTSDSTDWETTAPTYTGNELTPYINEIMLGASVTVTRTYNNTGSPEAPVHTNKIKVDINPQCLALELINIYKKEFPDSRFLCNGEITVKYTYGSGESDNGSQTVSWTPNPGSGSSFTKFDDPVSAENYAYKALMSDKITCSGDTSKEISVPGTDSTTPIPFQITEISFKVEKIYLQCKIAPATEYTPADYVHKLEATIKEGSAGVTLPSTDLALLPDTPKNQYFYTGFGVDDPRHNLYMGEGTALNWTPQYHVPSPESFDPAMFTGAESEMEVYRFSVGEQNKSCKPGDSGDKEPINAFADGSMVSTAYIANKPMRAIAELGMIHRADKWATLNLKKAAARIGDAKYDPSRAVTEESGYTYDNGDAALLDQVKLTDLVYTAGKVNLNRYPEATAQNFLFKALFDNIAYGVVHADNYESGTRVLSATAGNIRNVLGGGLRTGANQFLMSRGHMVDFLCANSAEFMPAGTDVQREIIPAASASLTSSYTTSPDIIQYVIVAQSILDVGTSDGISVYKPDAKGELKEKTNVKRGVFDYDSANKIYYDEIVGEAKMLITIRIDKDTKKAKLLRMEFID